MAERKNKKKQPDIADLRKYREKRNFSRTAEPPGGERRSSPAPLFVVQKHAARRLHYDLRLEADGVLKSWAVPRGPSYDPGEKRLAVRVEDHPLEYADFEGLIPDNEYGAGTVMVWDRGTWEPLDDWEKGLQRGKVSFRLTGRKLKGTWTLVRLHGSADEEFEESRDNWLLIKAHDEDARLTRDYDVTAEEPESAKTGRTLQQITMQRTAIWRGSRESGSPALRHQDRPPAPPDAPGAAAPWPEAFSPQLATLVTRLPEGGHWVSEIKYDGYRLLARINKGSVALITRRGQDWSEKFASLAAQLSRLPIRNAIIDGEVVVLDPDGTSHFQKLQNFIKSGNEKDLVYYAFDLPYYQDHDLGPVPLAERKTVLKQLLSVYRERIPSIRYSDHLSGSGEQVLREACRHGVEGIVAKREDSPYLQKRTRSWVKKKCINRQEFVIGGYTLPKGSRSHFGSLVLGYYNDERQLIYCGNVGTGFNEESIRSIHARLTKLEQKNSPFASPLDDARNRSVQFVAPRLAAEVEFTEWTASGHIRHPSFIALREDKRPEEITAEQPLPLKEPADAAVEQRQSLPMLPVRLTNPDKALYPETGITKKELAEYYLRVGQRMLPEAGNRPLVLVRCPEGLSEDIRDKCFYQKHLKEDIPESIRTTAVKEKGQMGLYPVIDDINGILSLVQLGVLEIHMLGCRADDVKHPDRMVFDLDPAPEVPAGRLIEATWYITDWIVRNKMKAFLKITGGKGIHIVVPMNRVLTWEELKRVSRAIAMEMVRIRPEWFVSTVTKTKRTGKILIDYLRNGLGASTIVPFSTRARHGAPVSFPIAPEDLTEELLANPVTVRNAAERLARLKPDPWEELT